MNMIKKAVDGLSGWLNNQSKKKLIENCVIIIVVGVIIVLAGGSFLGDSAKNKADVVKSEVVEQSAAKIVTLEDKEDFQKKVEGILSKIGGAGNVSVMITYVSGKEIVPAYDTKRNDDDTQEKDTGGGTRSIKKNDVENKLVYEETAGGIKKPVVLKELQPEVKGVVVVADGAGDTLVKESLIRAVQVLVDVPIHKIQVFPRNK